MLNVSNLSSEYGAIRAVKNISLEVPPGSMVALIGSNGAGKSTTLNSIAGLHRQTTGSIILKGEEIAGLPVHQIVNKGLAIIPEGRWIIAPLTVAENISLSTFASRGKEEELKNWIYELFPQLYERRQQIAGSLSGGEQQMLSMARALMTNPEIMLLDEPAMGLAPTIIDLVYEAILSIHKEGMSILLVEQNAAMALSMCSYAYVLQRGEIVLEGKPSELMETPEIMDAYLG
jgi:branched-chain amino acid transport system ATP-binding protein